MSQTSDPRLQLAPPGAHAGAWLFTLGFALPLSIAVTTLIVRMLRGQPLPLSVAGNPALAAAAWLAGATLLCGLLWRGLAWMMRRQALAVSAERLEVLSSFYRCRTPLAELNLAQARVVDLDERTELKPTFKTNGFSIPGFHSGWFLLRNRRRTFVAIGGERRKLWLPGHGRYDLLLEPKDAAALLARLRELAATRGHG